MEAEVSQIKEDVKDLKGRATAQISGLPPYINRVC
jgi:hypothetical protein